MAIDNLCGGLARRDFLKMTAMGIGGASLSGWMNVLASHAAQTSTKTKSCILLFMDGGPSHKDTFDLKPGTKDGGEFKPIATNVPGIQISEHFPKFAKLMNHAAIVRGMSTGEGAHGRAKYYMHTGYREGVGGLSYPSIGSIVSSELGRPEFPAAELRHHRQPQLWGRLPRRQASADHHLGPAPRRREPQAARRGLAVRGPRRSARRRWSRPSTASTRRSRPALTKPPISGPSR